MIVIEWQQFLENGLPLEGRRSSMTVGIFDGVHRGHQVLLERVVSHNADYVPVVLTFKQNHKTDNENKEHKDIFNFQQRLTMFEKLGIQITIVIEFTESFMLMSGISFLEILLKHGNVGFFAVGKNFRCGYQLDTNANMIKDFFASNDISAEIVSELTEGTQPISSSRIRTAIASGDLLLAKTMLGHEIY